MTHTTDYYFESHITLAPMPEELEKAAHKMAEYYGFKVAKLYKRNGELSRDDAFMSARSLDFDELGTRMYRTVYALEYIGCEIRRYKLENILIDVRK